ncbi:bzip family transcription factor [Fusarium albosuccineum]|uniref:Bzip family transcription factor n=1 Tax=Fusarium albosuccineum TaxID=1237068 RepID=A0A8H4L9R9_9HYPO|nr:bzip family transcription factor [Fusarium albosuccineum]
MLEPPQPSAVPHSSRKRTKISDENDDDQVEGEKKRSRGRPRLDTKDETAQDRRRTQIRLAQRAYRNRKDTAITTLEQKVKDLEQANEDMGREFMSFFDFVLAQGMLEGAPEVTRRLNDTTRKFLSFTRRSGEDAPREISTATPIEKPTHAEIHIQERQGSSSSSSSSPSEEYAAPNVPVSSAGPQQNQQNHLTTPPRMDGTLQQQLTPPVSLPYEIITMPTSANASFPVYNTQAPVPLGHNPFITTPMAGLPSPSSYAPQERSFGRRLQRATVEAGLRLASMPNPPPHRYAAVFGFCLLFEPREAIIRRLSTVLTKSRQETLNNWKFPFTNLGGAGTFFPDNGTNGGPSGMNPSSSEMPIGNQGLPEPLKPSELTGFSMGPFNPDTESARDDRIDHRMRMMYQGFEGDFFDADEVETYLRQRGIVIPENADFVDAEIDINAFDGSPDMRPTMGNTASNNFFGGQHVSTSGPELFTMSHNSIGGAANMWSSGVPTTLAAATSSMSTASLMAPVMGNDLGSLMPNMQPPDAQQFNLEMSSFMDFSRGWATDTSWMKTKVTIDVNRLVAEMTSMAVCLGRTPGLRPKDVNKAVKSAIALSGH